MFYSCGNPGRLFVLLNGEACVGALAGVYLRRESTMLDVKKHQVVEEESVRSETPRGTTT